MKFLLLKGVFLNMKDVHMGVPYISIQSNKKFHHQLYKKQILYKTTKINFKNSLEMEILFF